MRFTAFQHNAAGDPAASWIFRSMGLFRGDAVKCSPGQNAVTVAHRFAAESAEVLQKLGKITADHRFC